MRVVQRRYTARKPWTPAAPWTFRSEYPTGAPRVCRSNYHWPVMLRGTSGPVEVGIIDRMLHLYSHWGLTTHSAITKIDGVPSILYDYETEWPVALSFAFWIEFVSDPQGLVARISREDAEEFGHRTEHGSRSVWAVPMKHYSVHRRQQ